MADGLNRIFLLGNLGANAELRHTQSGTAVVTMRVATTESYYDKAADKRQERTDWHNVVLWGKRAEGLARYLTKGTRLFVEGSLRTRSFEGRDGKKQYRTEVNASNVLLLGGRGEGAASGGAGRARDEADDFGPPPDVGGGGTDPGFNDDDIPF